MKIIRNKFIPFPGYKCINLFGILFVKNNAKIDDVIINHESIHSAQIAEVMIASVPFALLLWLLTNVWLGILMVLFSYYLWYMIEWLVHLVRFKDAHLAYRRISFEREAYTMQSYTNYTKNRERFSFLNYIG